MKRLLILFLLLIAMGCTRAIYKRIDYVYQNTHNPVWECNIEHWYSAKLDREEGYLSPYNEDSLYKVIRKYRIK